MNRHTMTVRRRSATGRRIAVQWAAFACLLAVGCGGDDAKTPAEPAQTPEPVAQKAKKSPVSAPAAAPGPREVAREILKRSLNTTVTGRSAFESAPLYRLSVDVDYELFTYAADFRLDYENLEEDALKELVFLLYPNSPELSESNTRRLAVKDVKVGGQPVDYELRGPALRLKLSQPLAPGQSATVTMAFRGNLHRLKDGEARLDNLAWEQALQMVLGGGNHGGYGVYSVGEDIVSMALWYPVLAAYDERGWDLRAAGQVGDVSYFDVANYEVEVQAPASVTVVGTGVEVARTETDGVATSKYYAGAVREFTLQMSERYQSASAFVDGVKVTSWFRDTEATAGRKVLGYAKEALRVFNQEFGPYPYTELDVVEAPLVGGAGGVEFPGLVTVARMFYLPDRPQADDPMSEALLGSKYFADTLEFVVAHEVAHEWWNAVVGSDSKRHPFVDEALANHSAIRYFEVVHGKPAAELQRDVQLRLPYQISRLLGAKDRPVDLPTSAFDGTLEYAATVYGKGALFFERLRKVNGETAHFGTLKDYYDRYRFKVATPDDLIGNLARSSRDPERTRRLARRWLKESHGDEDIDGMRLTRVAAYVFGDEAVSGPVGTILGLMEKKGLAEVAKVATALLSGEPETIADLDWGALAQLATSFLSEEDQKTYGPLIGVLTTLAQDPSVLKDGLSVELITRLAKTALGTDAETTALIDAAGTLIKLLDAL